MQANINVKRAIAAAISPKKLELIILPTEKCNFRCTYCYEDFEIGRMKPDVVAGVKALISNRVDDLQELKLTWFGGEPLLEKDLMKEIATHARDACAGTGCTLVPGEVTTNGYLLNKELFIDLVDLGHRLFQVSLDGDKEAHESSRRHIAGKPTFDRIVGHLRDMRSTELDFKVLLRLHLKPDNRESMLTLAANLRAEFLNDSRFSVLVKSIGNWGGPNSGKFDTLQKDDVASRTRELQAALFGAVPAPKPPGGEIPYVCYASTPSSLLIRPDGRIGKCTTALSDAINDVGRIHADGTITFYNEALQFWFTGLTSKEESQLACPYHSVAKPLISAPVPIQFVRNASRVAA